MICYLRDKISIVNVYIDNFFLASNTINTLNTLKQSLVGKYNTKDHKKIKIIIGW